MKKKIPNQNEVENSEKLLNEKSEEFLRFEQGLRQIFSLTPAQAKKIRDEPVPQDPNESEEQDN